MPAIGLMRYLSARMGSQERFFCINSYDAGPLIRGIFRPVWFRSSDYELVMARGGTKGITKTVFSTYIRSLVDGPKGNDGVCVCENFGTHY